MRIVITGGSGFLGSHVAEQAKAQGHDVVCLVRKSSNTRFLEELGVELAQGAVDDPASLPKAVEGADAVVHCAGLVKARSLEDFERVHKDGTLALADAAKRHAPKLRRFVHVSTAGVMGEGRKGAPHRESDTPAPATMYAKSKLSGESALLERKGELPLVVLRPPAIYGPRDGEILAFFQMVRRSRMAVRMGGSMRELSMIYGPDCAEACLAAITAEVPSGSTYFVEDGYTYSFEEMAHAIAAAYGVGLMGTFDIPSPVVRAAAFGSELFGKVSGKVMMFTRDKLGELLMQHFTVDGSRARAELGWQPKTPFSEGAKATAAWYRQHRWD